MKQTLKSEVYRGKKVLFFKTNNGVNAVWQNRKKDNNQYYTNFNRKVTGQNKSQAFQYAKKYIDKIFR
jgi:hypothetical protein